ncbi:MAG: hypothetical protein EB084_16805, partial [Proteobacteria bacterium]|nr:hypothetical protein [Pseudomonadota bacterium]
MITIRGTVDPTTYRGAFRPARLHVPGGSAPVLMGSAVPTSTESISDSVKSSGAIGALVGAAAGRGLVVAGGASAGAVLARLAAQALPSPFGVGLCAIAEIGAGFAAGMTAGVIFERKTRTGRVIGGLAGACAGITMGAALAATGWHPSPALARATRSFSLTALPPKLADPSHIGTPTLRHDRNAKAALRAALPG